MADVDIPPHVRAVFAGNPLGLQQYKKRVQRERKREADEKAAEEIRNDNFGYFVRPEAEKKPQVAQEARQLQLPL